MVYYNQRLGKGLAEYPPPPLVSVQLLKIADSAQILKPRGEETPALVRTKVFPLWSGGGREPWQLKIG